MSHETLPTIHPTTSPLAHHAVEQLTNSLHQIAREFHNHDSLRTRIARELAPLLATEPAALTPASLAALIGRQLDDAHQQAQAIGTPSGHIHALRTKLTELRNTLADVLANSAAMQPTRNPASEATQAATASGDTTP